MELKIYLRILLKKWWIVIPTFLITFTAGLVFTYTQTPIYSAGTTYVVVPSSSFSDVTEFARGLDMLGRREEIATTFSEIAASGQVKRLALDSLSLPLGQGYSISSKLVAGTNIIKISVEGPDPVIVRDLANAVGKSTEKYVKGLYEVFTLVPLDEASVPKWPQSPNKSLNLILAAAFGLVLGGGLAFLSEYLEAPFDSVSSMNIIDAETGVYNQDYFLHRLSEEMVRAKRNRYPLSLALMRFDSLLLSRSTNGVGARADLRQVSVLIKQYLREEDIVAYMDENVFALLLPDMTGDNAKALMEYLQSRVAWATFTSKNGTEFNFESVVGVTTYNHNGTTREELIAQANQALQLADVDDSGKAYLIKNLVHAS